eukprot:CAMPEP_0170131422 /NCGR_PEP_ID=MMETSP0020_2-20130122/23240_1 /TAXON_ID=98059 /ORGANISM="Dinobryon sp., Strain UTEXLB2267" /LENGTH=232 /DNA_ID=CAMNT_0010366497 /DNA_START=482 /DNA_END=1181 /DNA_ORIENTATION=-
MGISREGDSEGELVGDSLGTAVGRREGRRVGFLVGRRVGFLVGCFEGSFVGTLEGDLEGTLEGILEGTLEGLRVVDVGVGLVVGEIVTTEVGTTDGRRLVGIKVGALFAKEVTTVGTVVGGFEGLAKFKGFLQSPELMEVDDIVECLNRNMHPDHSIGNSNSKALLRNLISSLNCGMWTGLEGIECSKDSFQNYRSFLHNNRTNVHNILQIDKSKGVLQSVVKVFEMEFYWD